MYQLHSRHGEKGAVPFRSARFYTVDSEWWFAIRRGPDQGPYATRAAAKQGLIEYLNDQFAFERQLLKDRHAQQERLTDSEYLHNTKY